MLLQDLLGAFSAGTYIAPPFLYDNKNKTKNDHSVYQNHCHLGIQIKR